MVVWMFVWRVYRIITILLIAIIGLVGVTFAFEILMAKFAPQNRLVSCNFLTYDQCKKRPDCLGFTVGGVRGAAHSLCVKR